MLKCDKKYFRLFTLKISAPAAAAEGPGPVDELDVVVALQEDQRVLRQHRRGEDLVTVTLDSEPEATISYYSQGKLY